MAGGLAPDLRSGDLVIGSHVASVGEPLTTSIAIGTAPSSRATRRQDDRFIAASIAAHDRVRDASRRQGGAACGQSGALAVDMESHIAATYARQHGLPFAVIRAISDPAHAQPAGNRNGCADGRTAMSILRKCLQGCCAQPRPIAGADCGRHRFRARLRVVTPRSPSSWPALRPRRRGSLIASSAPATRTRIQPGAAYPSRFPAPSVRTCGCRAATPTAPSADC